METSHANKVAFELISSETQHNGGKHSFLNYSLHFISVFEYLSYLYSKLTTIHDAKRILEKNTKSREIRSILENKDANHRFLITNFADLIKFQSFFDYVPNDINANDINANNIKIN